MDRNFIEAAKKRLFAKREKLQSELANLKQEDPFVDEGRVDDNAAVDTEAKEQEGHARVEAIELEINNTLARVERAFELIESGRWGICEKDGKPIAKERLELDPTMTTCVDHEEDK